MLMSACVSVTHQPGASTVFFMLNIFRKKLILLNWLTNWLTWFTNFFTSWLNWFTNWFTYWLNWFTNWFTYWLNWFTNRFTYWLNWFTKWLNYFHSLVWLAHKLNQIYWLTLNSFTKRFTKRSTTS